MVKRVIQFVNQINQNKYVTQNFDNYQRDMSKDLFNGTFENIWVEKKQINNLFKIIKKVSIKHKVDEPQNIQDIYKSFVSNLKKMSDSDFNRNKTDLIIKPLFKYVYDKEIKISEIVDEYANKYNNRNLKGKFKDETEDYNYKINKIITN